MIKDKNIIGQFSNVVKSFGGFVLDVVPFRVFQFGVRCGEFGCSRIHGAWCVLRILVYMAGTQVQFRPFQIAVEGMTHLGIFRVSKYIKLDGKTTTKEVVLLGFDKTTGTAQSSASGLRRIPAAPESYLKGNPLADDYWDEFREAIHHRCVAIAAEKKHNPPTPVLQPVRETIQLVHVPPTDEEMEAPKKVPSGFRLTMYAFFLALGLIAAGEDFFVKPTIFGIQTASIPIQLPNYGIVAGGRSIPPMNPVTGRSPRPTLVPNALGNGVTDTNADNYRPLPKTYGKGVLRTEPYGRYESCQGLDAQGFKPCKKNRRWYIVNEARNIHHRINFDLRTHRDIFAIRPFQTGVAQVFFYDGRMMYLAFCVGLDDRVLECSVSA